MLISKASVVGALESGLILDIRDMAGKQLWNSYSYNDGMCQQMLYNMTQKYDEALPELGGQNTNIKPTPFYMAANR